MHFFGPIQVVRVTFLCSGGDDSGLFVAEFNVCSTESRSCGLHVIREEIVQSAHTSSVTGTCISIYSYSVYDTTRV